MEEIKPERSNNTTESYAQQCEKYKEILKTQHELESRIEELKAYQDILKDILCRCAGKTLENKVSTREYPIILGSCNTRMSIVNIGILPFENSELFHTKDAIYPINYKMKRKYVAHTRYNRKVKDKVTYTCTITRENVFEIECEDGYRWVGENCWDDFVTSFDRNQFSGIEDFFGFNNLSLIKLIEDLGDISLFPKYVRLSDRKKNK